MLIRAIRCQASIAKLDFLPTMNNLKTTTTFAPIVRLCRSFDRMGDKNSLERQGKHYIVSTSIYFQKILNIFNNHKLPEENHLSTSNNQPVLTEDNRCQL